MLLSIGTGTVELDASGCTTAIADRDTGGRMMQDWSACGGFPAGDVAGSPRSVESACEKAEEKAGAAAVPERLATVVGGSLTVLVLKNAPEVASP